jgi:hypothetical protein
MNLEYHTYFIRDKANEIKERLAGGKLYGFEIDLNSIDQCIVAAYFLGQTGVGMPYYFDNKESNS